MPQTTEPLILKITKKLHWGERILLVSLMAGLLLAYLSIDFNIIRISLAGLALTYFLYAYKPMDTPVNEGEENGFGVLFVFTILPKILWISCAISVFGIFVSILHLGNQGYERLLMSGGSAIMIGILLMVYFAITGVRNAKTIAPVLLRAVPLVLADFYLLFF